MNISMSFRNIEPSEHLKRYAEDRFAKLFRYLPGRDGVNLAASFEVEKFRHRAEVVLTGDGVRLLAREESGDMYSAVDIVQGKLLAQVRRLRERELARRRRGDDTARNEPLPSEGPERGDSERDFVIVESDRFEPKPMMAEEAAMQLECMNKDFLVFLNAETERLNVIYRRKDDEFGLVDPGM